MLQVSHIVKTYDTQPLLTDVSFEVQAGETVGLLGASGSGKSTLLRMIAGLEVPERGTIYFNGADLTHIPAHARDFGLVFQDYGLFPHLNVFENVAFGLRMRRQTKAQIADRVKAMLAWVNLTGFERRSVTELSGGEQQRVALARALAPQPRLLMFDEPLGALDAALKKDVLDELRQILRRANIPAIYVTHDHEEAFAIADRLLLLHAGGIIRAGTPAQVWQKPGSAPAARMLGAGNVLTGSVIATGEKQKVATAAGNFDLPCSHHHPAGAEVTLWLKQATGAGTTALQARAEDVLFKREQFEIRCAGGLVFRLPTAPQIGAAITIQVKVECLE